MLWAELYPLKIPTLESEHPGPWNVTLFGHRVIADVTSRLMRPYWSRG